MPLGVVAQQSADPHVMAVHQQVVDGHVVQPAKRIVDVSAGFCRQLAGQGSQPVLGLLGEYERVDSTPVLEIPGVNPQSA